MISLRVGIFGEIGCGQSSLLIRLLYDRFEETGDKLIEDTYRLKFSDPENDQINALFEFSLTGDGGSLGTRQEGTPFQFMSYRSYSYDINCWMLLFDITSKKSFEQLPSLHEYITTKANTELSGFIVVGTKLDLAEERRISEIEAAAFSRSIGADYVEISSKTGKNVSTLMPSLLAMHRKYLQSKAKRQKEAKKCILL
jgi:GTPase SAR1 family protein